MFVARKEEGARHFVDGQIFVTDGSTICPHPLLADQRKHEHEPYEGYVRRHCRDHNLGEFITLDDAERNLAVWCLYFYARHVQGNESLGVGPAIKAAWEPCWEDAEFLANDVFHPDDLEQNTPWEKRHFRLPPFAERRKDGAVRKRKKKLTKARGTQKTSWAKAFITWKHLRARFVFDNCNYRVLVISATSTLARDAYFDPFKTMWGIQKNLKRLFGSAYSTLSTTRRVCLLVPGSNTSRDHIRLRWNIQDEGTSGEAAISLMIAGVTTTTTGQRWDLVVLDDLVVPQNSRTPEQRAKVVAQIADLRKQLDGQGEVVYLNTPHHAGDASSQIDKEQGHEYHIMYRPAAWTSSDTGAKHLYWETSALGRPVWDAARIEEERTQPDFYSQVMLLARDENDILFTKEMFKEIPVELAPIEVRYGLGAEVTQPQALELEKLGVRIRSYNFVDPSGNDTTTPEGDDTAVVGWRIDRYGNLWLTFIDGGQWNASQEHNGIFASWLWNRPQLIQYEISGAHSKHVKQTYLDFQARKAVELDMSISIPITWEQAAGGSRLSKLKRMESMYPFASTGRVYILAEAGTKKRKELFVEQFTDIGYTAHDDYADAGSRILQFVRPPSQAEVEKKADKLIESHMEGDGTVHLNVGHLLAELEGPQDNAKNWGLRGRG